MNWARTRPIRTNLCCFPDIRMHVSVEIYVKFFVDGERAVDASEVTFFFHYIYATR